MSIAKTKRICSEHGATKVLGRSLLLASNTVPVFIIFFDIYESKDVTVRITYFSSFPGSEHLILY